MLGQTFMQLGIDITSIIYGRGVSRYTANLVTALTQRAELSLALYGSSLRQQAELENFVKRISAQRTRANVSSVIQPYPPRLQEILWNKLHLNPVKRLFPKLDVFHSWDWLQPPDRELPLVSTIHDLAILKFPETAHPKILKMHQQAWKVLKEREAQIIAVSQATKQDIVKLLEIPSHRVHVIYESLPIETIQSSKNVTEEEYEQLRQKLHLDQPYILFVGTREPRKNLKRLIEAWIPLAKDFQLVIAGESGWDESDGLAKTVNHKNLRFLGKVSDVELAVLYGEAELFAYPSIYEGFGLPILEAFHHGTPVLTSDISSMPEVAGNAAELIDPQSVESIRKGIEKVLGETPEQQRQRLQKMIIRLHQFSWDRVAEETVKVYQRAIESHA